VANPGRKPATRSSRGKRTRGESSAKSKGVWARLRRKLAQGAECAVRDAQVGTMVFCTIYFGVNFVALGLIGLDTVAGTSVFSPSAGWFLGVKLTALGAGLAWGLLILAPAALLARCLRTSSAARLDGVLTKRLVRPIVDALAVYVAILVGVAVWNLPPLPGPPEFVVPGPDVYGAELARLNLRLMALRCMQDPSPPHCSRQDIRHIQARFYLQWTDEHPAVFEGRHGWG
jgi:hypothetical protein